MAIDVVDSEPTAEQPSESKAKKAFENVKKVFTREPKEKSDKNVEKSKKVNEARLKRLEKQRRKYLIPKDEKLRKPKKSSNVLFLDHKKFKKDSNLKKFWEVIIDTFYEFANITKVNGMYYLRRGVTTGWLRVLWSIIMIGLFSFAITLLYLLYSRYVYNPTRVIISPSLPISAIPFPAITICHPQNIMEYKSKEFVKKKKLPLGASKEKAIEILPLLAGFVERQWVYPRKEDLEMVDDILRLNYMTVEDAINDLGTVCNDFLLVCYFNGKRFPCMQKNGGKFITFVESYSYLGACCSFNYNPNGDDNDEHLQVDSFGDEGGLNVVVTGRPQASDGKSGAIYSEGFVAMVHHPNDFPVESHPTTYLGFGKETFINIDPLHSSCTDQVLALPFAQRKCIIPSDIKRSTYRQPACLLECLRNEIHKRCHCHPFYLPKSDNETKNYEACIAKDISCFINNFFEFKTLQCDQCYPSCTDIYYKTNSYSVDMHTSSYDLKSINKFYTETNLTKEELIVRIYFGTQTVAAFKKIVVMSWISLLSNLGGSFSLCLGISMLSFCEVFFFLFIRLYKHFKRIYKVEPVIPKYRPHIKNKF